MTDTPEIPPALTPEQWHTESIGASAFRATIFSDLRGRGVVVEMAPWDNDTQGYGAPIRYLLSDVLHGLAALCLYGQSFGFTHEELRALRAGFGSDCPDWDDYTLAKSAFAKIAALLPRKTL